MFLGINTFWALLRLILGLGSGFRVIVTGLGSGLAARAKMSLSWAKNIFMPANINSVVISLLAIGRRNQLNPHGFSVQIFSLCS